MSACWSGGTCERANGTRASANTPARTRRQVMGRGPREGRAAGGRGGAWAVWRGGTILIRPARQINRASVNSTRYDPGWFPSRRPAGPVVELLLPVHGEVALQQRPLLVLDAPQLLAAVQGDRGVVGDGEDNDEEE